MASFIVCNHALIDKLIMEEIINQKLRSRMRGEYDTSEPYHLHINYNLSSTFSTPKALSIHDNGA